MINSALNDLIKQRDAIREKLVSRPTDNDLLTQEGSICELIYQARRQLAGKPKKLRGHLAKTASLLPSELNQAIEALILQQTALRRLADESPIDSHKAFYAAQEAPVAEAIFLARQEQANTKPFKHRPKAPPISHPPDLVQKMTENATLFTRFEAKVPIRPSQISDSVLLVKLVKFYKKRLREAETRLSEIQKGKL